MVQLIVTAGADIDSQDNRKVSCLMAAFRKGHIKVVKWMVKHVNQFPSDGDLSRYIATITDKVRFHNWSRGKTKLMFMLLPLVRTCFSLASAQSN